MGNCGGARESVPWTSLAGGFSHGSSHECRAARGHEQASGKNRRGALSALAALRRLRALQAPRGDGAEDDDDEDEDGWETVSSEEA